jgi:uncharacterized protein YdeI (YjbR/CyaY-like superfamily)
MASHPPKTQADVDVQSARNPALDAHFADLPRWREETLALRAIALGCGLSEVEKWGQPCYTTGNDRNVVIIHAFKNYCGLGFIQGALLKDTRKLLVTPGKLQAGRQLRFTTVAEITAQESTIIAYLREAIAVEASGAKVQRKSTADIPVPAELKQAFTTDAELKRAFAALTPGRQRSWLYHIEAAKQAATRETRIAKGRAAILDGKGFNER